VKFGGALLTDQFIGPDKAVYSVCVCVRALTFVQNDFWPRYWRGGSSWTYLGHVI